MRHVKRLLFFTIIIVLACFYFIPSVLAHDGKQRIYDDANLLTDDEVKKLENLAYEHSREHETDFIILTTLNAEKDISLFLNDYYDENAPGYDKPHGNAVIFAIDMTAREFDMGGFYKGEKYLSDSRLDSINEKITPYLSSGNYYEAFALFIETGSDYMNYVPWIHPESFLLEPWFQILISFIIAGGIVGMMAYNSGGKVTVNERTYTGSFQVLRRKDIFITKHVTKRRKPTNNSSGGGGGGITRGGHSRSGSRGKF